MSPTIINFSLSELTKRLLYQNVQVVFGSIVKERRQLRGEGLQPLDSAIHKDRDQDLPSCTVPSIYKKVR